MQAAQMAAPGRLEVVDVPIPEPADGEVLVRTHRSSVCGSDLYIVYDGFHLDDYPAPPGFPGHEGSAVLLRVAARVRALAGHAAGRDRSRPPADDPAARNHGPCDAQVLAHRARGEP